MRNPFPKWLFPWTARREIKRLSRERDAALKWIRVTHKTDSIQSDAGPIDLVNPKETFRDKLLSKLR